MRRLLVSVLGAAALLAVATTAGAITNGQSDAGRHPYVALLVFDDAPGHPAWRCSGSLIAPTVVLTAAHCTSGAVAARAWFQDDVTSAAEPTYPGPGGHAVEGTPHTNPGYDVGNPWGGGNGLPAYSYGDVGVVVLARPVTTVGHAQLPAPGLVDTLRNRTPVDFVGYGVQYQAQVPGSALPQPPPYYRWTGPRVRMFAPSELVSGRFVNSADVMRLALNPGGGSGGTCFGDSGGPDLLGGTSTVLAVNSYVTNVNCSGVGYSTRVDVPAILDWIDGFVS